MALEHRRGDEGLLAQVALVLLVAVVHHLDVNVERVLPLEGGVALVALERPLTWGMDGETEGGAAAGGGSNTLSEGPSIVERRL